MLKTPIRTSSDNRIVFHLGETDETDEKMHTGTLFTFVCVCKLAVRQGEARVKHLPWDGAVAEPVDEGHPKPLTHNGIQNPNHPFPRPGNPPPSPTVGGGRFQACNKLKSCFPRNAYEPRQPVSYFPLHGLHVKPRARIHHFFQRHPLFKRHPSFQRHPCG